MSGKGWIKLYRELLVSEIFASEKGLKIWVWILLKANHKSRFFTVKIGRGEKTIKIERGQFLFGRFKAEDELSIDGSTVYKWIKKMEAMGMIGLDSNNHYTILTVCNFNAYNNISNEEVTAIKQPLNSNQTAIKQPCNTNKNVNNVKNVNNILPAENNLDRKITLSKFDEFWKRYPKKVDKGKALSAWEKLCNKSTKEKPTMREILKAIILQKKSERWQDNKFIPHPTTWLNQSRWLDDAEQMKAMNYDSDKNKSGKKPSQGTGKTDYSVIPPDEIQIVDF